ncbi:MAG: hypothetical protein OEM49_15910 [Myxococcales bacterium]|nr:hypothetical protein [Myxococcales bacterium]MDH5307262.1 hypothetical protein [Myxococcales bacterium]MDH5565563.1 hypothetical protein [Myxococcales bacterium]
MLRRSTLLLVGLFLLAPALAWADPPAHAPAYGYRSKGKSHHEQSGGFEVIFDSERGVQVAVGFPNVFFHEGQFFRYFDGSWQVSVRADGGWSVAAAASVPVAIHKAHKHPPGPAKIKDKGKHKK